MGALLLAVLIGFGVLVLDAGNLFWERRSLQNGADAAALAAGEELLQGATAASAYDTARWYADANNARGAYVRPPDHADPGFVTTSSTVSVTARTGTYDAEGELTSILAAIFGIDQYATRATATVTWGALGQGVTIPIAICEHAWDYFTNDGSTLPSGPPGHYLRTGVPPEHIQPDADCSNPAAGDQPPGGFGFLEANGDCQAVVAADGWTEGSDGNKPDYYGTGPDDCDRDAFYAMLRDIVDSEGTVLIPIFDVYDGEGDHTQYHIVGFGAWRLLGYNIKEEDPYGTPPDRREMYGWPPHTGPGPDDRCPGSASCLLGYFTEFVTLDGIAGGGSGDFGVTLVSLIE